MMPLRIGLIGSRGIPANYGGFETFVDKLAVGLKQYENVEIYVVGDPNQKAAFNGQTEYEGVHLLYSRFDKSAKPNLYFFDSGLKVMKKVDIIFSCGVAGAFSTWFFRLAGKKYYTNPDGLGWRREKYGKLKSTLLAIMFYVSYKTSSFIVPDSQEIGNFVQKNFGKRKNIKVIEYGSEVNEFNGVENETTDEILKKFEVRIGAYHLVVSRLEPENQVHKVVEGYGMSDRKHPLIIIGNLSENAYIKNLRSKAEGKNIRFIGGVYNQTELKTLRTNAISYFHGHKVGGTNPSLLEAMASKNLCVCHDNVFNREVTGGSGLFFKDYEDVDRALNYIEAEGNEAELTELREGAFKRIEEHYNWDRIVREYYELFKSA
ncbi:MAG: glycosyltransferase family 1 protein [Roseivirga sp.]